MMAFVPLGLALGVEPCRLAAADGGNGVRRSFEAGSARSFRSKRTAHKGAVSRQTGSRLEQAGMRHREDVA